jgi:amino acid transporter
MPILELPVINLLAGAQPASSLFPMPTPLLAEISGAQWIAISAILGGLTFTILLIIFGLKYVQRRQELWHETARAALEKGQPLPPLPADMRNEKHPEQNNDFRAGLIMVATGAGLYIFLATFIPPLRFVATIPGFIGVAMLLYATLNALLGRKSPSASDRPPQP